MPGGVVGFWSALKAITSASPEQAFNWWGTKVADCGPFSTPGHGWKFMEFPKKRGHFGLRKVVLRSRNEGISELKKCLTKPI